MKLYIATKLHHAAVFRSLRDFWKKKGIIVSSRWIDFAGHEHVATPADFHAFWLVDEQDVRNSDALLAYGEADDVLCGALVEVGMAIALGKIVFVVGSSPSFGTWTNHPSVIRADSPEQATEMLLRLFPSEDEKKGS
jgi:nucleoside 2-deoxyribosyltransferase